MYATLTTFIWLRKSNNEFFLSYISCKKINVGIFFKLWENCYLIILSIHIVKLEISGCDKGPTPGDSWRRGPQRYVPDAVGHGGRCIFLQNLWQTIYFFCKITIK
jgi:hypothetical protein